MRFAIVILLSFLTSWNVAAIPFQGHKILISGPTPYAVEVGRKIASEGGNVVDVAVAVAFCLSVTAPYFGSLGGAGFALIKMDGPVQALEFREAAPAAVGADYFKKLPKDASIHGGTAVAVPGLPAGLWAMHLKFGKLKWPQLVQPAIDLANKGFQVSGDWVYRTQEEWERFNKAGRAAFSGPQGVALKPGEILKQPELAKALIELKNKKLKGFYEGPVAEDIVHTVQATGGAMTMADLRNYAPHWIEPMITDFEGYKIYLMPPPSSGGVVISTALHLIDKLNLKSKAFLSVDELHLLSEIEARAFRGRILLGDPAFHKNPITQLTSPSYLDELAKSVNVKKAVALEPLREGELKEKTETTHFSIMDSEGHAVAFTVTLNGTYGSGVTSEKYHIALNDGMDDFTAHPGEANLYGLVQGEGNQVAAGKRPLSSMSPTLVERDGHIVMSLGAPGGPRIISAVLQALYRVLAQKLDIDLAAQAPRVHHQFYPNKVFIDSARFSPEILQALRDRGHVVQEGSGMGKVYIVRLRPDGVLEAAFDARGEGAAGGF